MDTQPTAAGRKSSSSSAAAAAGGLGAVTEAADVGVGMDLSQAGDDVLIAIIKHLDPSDVVNVSLCSRTWRAAAEESFEARCKDKKWRLPRRPRGNDAHTDAPWRRLFRNNSCMRCVAGAGEFRVSRLMLGRGSERVRVFSLCKRCAGEPEAVARLQSWGLFIDFQSVNGKTLPGIKLKKGNKKDARALLAS